MPAQEYVICGFEAKDFTELVTVALNKATNYSGLWIEKHGLVRGAFAPELYYASTPETTYMELMIPITNE